MFNKKLNKNDLEEVRKRVELVNQHLLIAKALNNDNQRFITGLLPKYQCDMNKKYTIDLKTGTIVLDKNKEKKQ